MSTDVPQAAAQDGTPDAPLRDRTPQTREEQWIAANVERQTMATYCERCRAHVSADFVRTMGTPNGRVLACPSCTKQSALLRGAASNPDFEPVNGTLESHCKSGHREVGGVHDGE